VPALAAQSQAPDFNWPGGSAENAIYSASAKVIKEQKMVQVRKSRVAQTARGVPAAVASTSAGINKLTTALDSISTAVMMVDRNFIVTYVNAPTLELLTKNAAEFRKIWPSFDPKTIIGTCIDTFHKNPARHVGEPQIVDYIQTAQSV
jgi:hypothetical protein